MNLKEQLAEKQSALLALKEGIEAGDEKAIKEAAEIAEAIDAIQESIGEAAKAQAILSALSAEQQINENPEKEEKPMQNMAEFAVKSFEGKARQGERVNLAADYKANTDIQTLPASMAGLTTYYDPNIVLSALPEVKVIDLFGRETISGNALTYYVEGAIEGEADVVAEGEAKPQIHIANPTAKTVSLQKVAAFVKESDELLEDMPRLASVIENRLVTLHNMARESFVLGDTTYGLLNISGIQTATVAQNPTAVQLADAIYNCIANVQTATGFAADAVVMNPADYAILALGKDGEQRYYGGGYFAASATPTIWGIPVVISQFVSQGTFIVGAFKLGASVVEKGGTRIEMTNSDQNDFTRNIVTVRCESRLVLAVRYPAAFVKGTIQTS